jgi:hypothetical protein
MVSLRDLAKNPKSEHFVFPTDWADMGGRDHFVQIYTDEQHILRAVSAYFVHGLRFNDSCIMIATREHTLTIEALIRESYPGFDAAVAEGRFVILDAHETLQKFTVGGTPRKDLFNEVLGNVIKQAARVRKHVRAFGEMVAVLADEGHPAAAVELEALWNNLARDFHFRLFCAYPRRTFSCPVAASHFDAICTSHTHTLSDTD